MDHWAEQLVAHSGYVGLALLMLAETVFPPIPSELIMPLAGVAAGRGELSLAGAIAAGTIGAMLGNTAWYGIARAIGVARLRTFIDRRGRWLGISWSDVERGQRRFAHGGARFVCLGRLIPGLRSIVSIPAGLLGMPFGRFFGWSLLGTAGWTALLAGAGSVLGARYPAVGRLIGPLSALALAALVALYVWRVLTWQRRNG